MPSIKSGASIRGLQPQAVLAFIVAADVYKTRGVDIRMTEGTGSKHGTGSLHYVGLAIDIGTSEVAREVLPDIVKDIHQRLGDEYDVVLETGPAEHLHIEYQPK